MGYALKVDIKKLVASAEENARRASDASDAEEIEPVDVA